MFNTFKFIKVNVKEFKNKLTLDKHVEKRATYFSYIHECGFKLQQEMFLFAPTKSER